MGDSLVVVLELEAKQNTNTRSEDRMKKARIKET